jgi:hypothetical protein
MDVLSIVLCGVLIVFTIVWVLAAVRARRDAVLSESLSSPGQPLVAVHGAAAAPASVAVQIRNTDYAVVQEARQAMERLLLDNRFSAEMAPDRDVLVNRSGEIGFSIPAFCALCTAMAGAKEIKWAIHTVVEPAEYQDMHFRQYAVELVYSGAWVGYAIAEKRAQEAFPAWANLVEQEIRERYEADGKSHEDASRLAVQSMRRLARLPIGRSDAWAFVASRAILILHNDKCLGAQGRRSSALRTTRVESMTGEDASKSYLALRELIIQSVRAALAGSATENRRDLALEARSWLIGCRCA